MTKNKQVYQNLSNKQKDIPLFYRYEWYISLYGDDWDVAIEEQGGEVVGFMPYRIRSKKGFKLMLPEPLVPYQGVWMIYPKGLNHTAKLRLENKVIARIIEKLPKVDGFKQQFNPSFSNWLPFYWKGFEQTTRYTYCINDLSDLDTVFSNFKDTTRNKIRKAEKSLRVESSTDIDRFYQLKMEDYKKKNKVYPIPKDVLESVMNYTVSKETGEILIALDDNDNVHAMLYYMWDKQSAYYVHSVSNPDNSLPGAMSLLIWEAIKRVSDKTISFDFEGSMVESIEKYFRSFGTEQTAYFQINKTDSKVLKLLNY